MSKILSRFCNCWWQVADVDRHPVSGHDMTTLRHLPKLPNLNVSISLPSFGFRGERLANIYGERFVKPSRLPSNLLEIPGIVRVSYGINESGVSL